MPKIQLDLKGSPFPLGNTLDAMRRDALLCAACCNLSPATAITLLPRHGLEMDAGTEKVNIKAAERVGMLEPIPLWVDRDSGMRQDYYSFEFRTRLVDIDEAAQRGCPSCTLLEKVIGNLCPHEISFDDPCLVACLTFSSTRVLWVKIYSEPLVEDSDSEGSLFMNLEMGAPIGGGVGISLAHIEMYTLPGSYPLLGMDSGVARHILVNPASEASFTLIKSWLGQCVNGHTSCSEADSKAEQKLPRRVIDVGSDDNTTIRLYEHDDQPGALGSHYVALTHCWGRKKLPRLTKDTVAKKRGNIPWESLPKTFQDVIFVARGIGVQYVWIDSLCIIQDDADDWEREAAKMSSIYEGALMVIAATASGDSTGGCLFEREPYLEIEATIESSEPFSLFARKACPHKAFMSNIDRGELRQMLESDELMSRDYPLFLRAWCFQERLLGTRILHFLRHEMLFECLETLECECGTLNGYGENATRQLRQAVKLDKVPNFKDLLSEEDEQWRARGPKYRNKQVVSTYDEDLFNETWRRVVETYSQRQITYPTDIFPALSGLANRWSRMTGKRYLGGLWADGLLVGLMWHVAKVALTNDGETKQQQNTYTAPTWSWASVQREVRWPDKDYDTLEFFVEIDMQNSDCVYGGLDTFGRITSGWIVITGKVMCVQFKSVAGGTAFLTKNGAVSVFTPDGEISCGELAGKELVCLQYSTNHPIQESYIALVLTPVDVSERNLGDTSFVPENIKQLGGKYRRIGLATCPWDEWNPEEDSRLETLIIV
ncbi:heterokaryon incompatibility protein-domain-containing protein [Xylaria telfairii]|nr:heterokaryon incompatibility protein-domain-containing protein [Xylaria telfairii]